MNEQLSFSLLLYSTLVFLLLWSLARAIAWCVHWLTAFRCTVYTQTHHASMRHNAVCACRIFISENAIYCFLLFAIHLIVVEESAFVHGRVGLVSLISDIYYSRTLVLMSQTKCQECGNKNSFSSSPTTEKPIEQNFTYTCNTIARRQ